VTEPGWGTLKAAPDWRAVDCIADLHLQAGDPATFKAWLRFLRKTDCDALLILGDLFEVWVGDDVLDTQDATPDHSFARACCDALSECAQRMPLYVMHGNRDFLLGPSFYARTSTHPLLDPTLLDWGRHRWLLSHGDAWCLDDRDYMRFRTEVRTAAWQQTFLARPLAEREAVGRQLRDQSEARKRDSRVPGSTITYADVDTATAEKWVQTTGAQVLVHGHTHRPAEHLLAGDRLRLVLSDWDAHAKPPRAQSLRLHADGRWERRPWNG
jgi:UDP-2,3-diacylglucosamine hydrolase